MAKKILVVDDEESILDAVSLILGEEGYKVETTYKGGETFSKVSQFKPNLILLDVLMSGKDGRQICKALKADPEFKEIPVIMISAHPTAKRGAQECGANDFLAKPFNSKELLNTISKYIK